MCKDEFDKRYWCMIYFLKTWIYVHSTPDLSIAPNHARYSVGKILHYDLTCQRTRLQFCRWLRFAKVGVHLPRWKYVHNQFSESNLGACVSVSADDRY